jgi:long-chain acyl-CoA synthetase
MNATTLPRLLHRNAADFGGRAAIREKRGGIWQVLSWSEHAAATARFAAGLAAAGFAPGDKLAVIGDNRPRLYAALLAAQSLGGCGVPLWPDAEPDWIAQTLSRDGVAVVVAEDAEQVEKLIAIKHQLPALRLVVQTASRGTRQAEQAWLRSFEEFTSPGETPVPPDRSQPGDIAVLLHPAAGSRDGRDTALSHADLLGAAAALIDAEEIRQDDEAMAWLPMAWFGDVLSSLALALSIGFTCNCPEGPETDWRDLREIGPTILIAPPSVWNGVLADVEARAAHATWLKRTLFAWFQHVARRGQQSAEAGKPVPVGLQLRLAMGEALIYAPMRDQIGMRRLRWGNTGGEPLAPHVLRSFQALGINLKQNDRRPEPEGATWEPAHA